MSIVLRHEDHHGIEFFTVEDTGESGMSISGLARLCGKTKQSVSSLIEKAVSVKSSSKWLEPLFGQAFTCQSAERVYQNAKIVKDEFCACVIKYYAFSGSEQAQYALDRFVEKGVRAWIQDVTGWSRKVTPVVDYSAMPKSTIELAESWVQALKESESLRVALEQSRHENTALTEEVRWTAKLVDEYHDTNQVLVENVNKYKPKAQDYDLLEGREGFISGQELVKRLAVKNFSVRKLYDLLRENRILFKAKGDTLNQPYQRYIDNGWIKIRDVECPDGKKRPAPVFSWKAVVKIVKLMKSTGWLPQDCEVFGWNFSEDEFMKSAEPQTNVIELRRA